MSDDDFMKLLKGSGLYTEPHRVDFVAYPGAFRDPLSGRQWHAHHRTSELKHGYRAVSLCGIHLISGIEAAGEFPQPDSCQKCLRLSAPETLAINAFQLLQQIVAGCNLVGVNKANHRPLNQLIERDLVVGGGLSWQPTQLGWLNILALRKHPAYDPLLFGPGRTT